jgi:hypothetical protein
MSKKNMLQIETLLKFWLYLIDNQQVENDIVYSILRLSKFTSPYSKQKNYEHETTKPGKKQKIIANNF